MDGPINFGDRDSWWGLLVKGFEFTPLYCNPYNFEYYVRLFENYGFKHISTSTPTCANWPKACFRKTFTNGSNG